jgi:hypothetical protein
MPRYYFTIKHREFCNSDDAGTELGNDAAARAYALRVIRELREGGGYDDPQLSMIVTDLSGRGVVTLPFAEGAEAARSRQD